MIRKRKNMTYISGAMTSCKDTYRDNFKKAEVFLKRVGHETFNPVYLSDYLINAYDLHGREFDKDVRNIFLKEDIKALMNCDTIAMLPNWVDSEGAKLEKTVAEMCGIKIIYLKKENLEC